MPDFCSCGAELPPDALFCHKCGKPQRELTEVVDETPAPIVQPPPSAPPPPPARLDFRNPVALKIALMVAVGASALFWLLPFVNWLAAGYFAAFLYRRRTGCAINVGAGVRMGWLTGLLAFIPTALMSLAAELPPALSGKLAGTYEQQMKSFPFQDPAAVQRAARFMSTGPGVAVVMVFTLITLFIFITFLSMAGGALAAKLGQSRQPPGGSSA